MKSRQKEKEDDQRGQGMDFRKCLGEEKREEEQWRRESGRERERG